MSKYSGEMFSLQGKRALVTGASRGIGKEIALALAGFGAQVDLVARSESDLEEVVSEIITLGGLAKGHQLDVADLAQCKARIGDSEPFDILINNAGTNRPGPFVDVSLEDFDAVFDLNVRAAFFVGQAVAQKSIAHHRALSIINMSSQMGKVGAANRTVYCASKHAIEGLTKAMAVELAPHSVRVNSVCPTFVETPLTQPFFENQEFKKSVIEKIKLGRLAQPSDLVGAVIFLASDASGMMTGSSLVIDGGWTAG